MITVGLPPLSLSAFQDGLDAYDKRVDLRSVARSALLRGTLLGAAFAKSVWLRVAGAMDIRGQGRKGEKSYMMGIETAAFASTSDEGGLSVSVSLTNTSPHASFVEEGHSAFHLPSKINWSGPRVKQGKEGPYLHIPFRHTAFAGPREQEAGGYTAAAKRAMMPLAITREAEQLVATRRLNKGPQRSPGGQYMAADRYRWGERMHRDTTPGVAVLPNGLAFVEHRGERLVAGRIKGKQVVNPAWQSSKYEGLFRTVQPGGKGGGAHSVYTTIRTVTPRSVGWNVPAQGGRFVARRVASVLGSSPVVEDLERIVFTPLRLVLLGGA